MILAGPVIPHATAWRAVYNLPSQTLSIGRDDGGHTLLEVSFGWKGSEFATLMLLGAELLRRGWLVVTSPRPGLEYLYSTSLMGRPWIIPVGVCRMGGPGPLCASVPTCGGDHHRWWAGWKIVRYHRLFQTAIGPCRYVPEEIHWWNATTTMSVGNGSWVGR